MKSNSTSSAPAETKKNYAAPQLIEHGTIEEITGWVEDFSSSGQVCKTSYVK